jgi:hypothetical protein
MWRLWKRASLAWDAGIILPEEFALQKNLFGRKPIYSQEEVKEEVTNTPLLERRTSWWHPLANQKLR